MINNWEAKTLGDIAYIKRGLASQHLNYVDNSEEGVRLIRINDFKSDIPKFIKETSETNKLTIKRGDILIAGTGATAGISFLVNDLWNGLPFSYNAPRIRVKNGTSSTFVYFILNSDKIKKQQNKLFTGNAQPFLDTRAIASFIIPLPPLPEQQKIAEILSTVDDKIEIIDQHIVETQELKKGLMQRLLTKGIGHMEFKDSALGRIPKSWEVQQLNKICDVRDGTHDSPKYYEKGIPFVTSKNLTDTNLSFDDIKYISKEDHINFSKRSHVENGDILFGMIGTVGKPIIVDEDFEFSIKNVALLKFSQTKGLNNYYVLNLLKSTIVNNQFKKVTNGGVLKFVSLGNIRNLIFPIPPFPEQQKIADILRLVDEKLEVLSEKKIHYKELKQGLMQQLLTGKIRVKV